MPWSYDEDGLKVDALRLVSTPAAMAIIAGVVDLGAGAGLWRERAKTLPIDEKVWEAVEVFAPNVVRFRLRERYDRVRQIDFRRIKFSQYPKHLFIFGDVLEHLTAADAIAIVRRAASAGSVIIVMPFLPSTSAEQGAVDGNEAERHLHVWEWDAFLEAIAPIVDEVGLTIEIVRAPDGTGRNKGGIVLWHPAHKGARP